MKVAILTTDSREHYRDYSSAIPSFGTAPEALLQGFAQRPGVEVHVISCAQGRMQSPAKLAENVFFHSLYVPRLGWLRTAYQGCIRAIRRKLEEIRPDIVHGQGAERDCAITAVFSGFPNVVTLHGIMADVAKALKVRPGGYYWWATLLETFAVRRTLGVLCNSAHTEAAISRRARRTWRVPNAVRVDFFERAPTPRPTDKCILLNVGAVYANKRQLEVLRLAETLRGEGLDFELRFLGHAAASSPYGAEFLGRIEAAQREGWVRYLGFKPIQELIDHFDEASALVHVPVAESFGLVVAEALARNAKLFGFRVGGVTDIARDVEGVELFTDGDWDGLRRAIAKWIRAGHPRLQTSAAKMRQRYHPTQIARQHLQIYREVLSRDS